MKLDISFVVMCVLWVSGPDRLPPVLGYSLWKPNIFSYSDAQGISLWGLFNYVLRLDYKFFLNFEDPNLFLLAFF